MHCAAAYYGHNKLITLLLEYGFPLTIQNINKSLPID
jgi:hypothetical protein